MISFIELWQLLKFKVFATLKFKVLVIVWTSSRIIMNHCLWIKTKQKIVVPLLLLYWESADNKIHENLSTYHFIDFTTQQHIYKINNVSPQKMKMSPKQSHERDRVSLILKKTRENTDEFVSIVSKPRVNT